MYTAVTETAKTVSPLSIAISNGIIRSIDVTLSIMNSRKNQKRVEDLAYALKLEYPKESYDYVFNMATNLLKDGR
jgi:hypothetical protein